MGSFVWPLPGFSRISSPYGYRTFNGASEFHLGVDIPAPSGTAIYAARPGKVTKAQYSGSYGNLIILEHDDGYSTRYAHQSRFSVNVGDTVKAGQKIGEVGTTGNSTGNHLHFEVRKNGNTVNPLDYVNSSDSADKYTGDTGNSSSSADGSGSSGQSSSSSSGSAQKQTKDITWAALKSSTGIQVYKKTDLSDKPAYLTNGAEILIENDRIYAPAVKSGIKLERFRKGAPSKLTFACIKDDVLNFQEGNPVSFRYNGENAFFGYVFTKARTDNREIKVTCYDQIRYLKNEDTLSYVNKTYSELLGMIADDFGLIKGELSDTGYKIPQRIEEGTLLDILQNASDLTVSNTGKLFVLYDDFGKLMLKNIEDMKLNILIDEDTAQSFNYESSIDKNVYTRVKLAYDNDETGERELYVTYDELNQAAWGQLQYYEKLDTAPTKELLSEKAKTLLSYYGRKNRSLAVKGVIGDIRVRGGSSVVIKLNLGDIEVQNYMVVESAVHTFDHGVHTMDLTLIGIKGEFTA